MKKILLFVCIASAVLMLWGCASGIKPSDTSYEDKAKALVDECVEKAQQSLATISEKAPLREHMTAVCELENGTPKVYKLTSEDKREIFSSAARTINNNVGGQAGAMALTLTCEEGYVVSEALSEPFALYLEYEGEFSCIVAFRQAGENVVMGEAMPVINTQKGVEAFKDEGITVK